MRISYPLTIPYFSVNPFGGVRETTLVQTIGGDAPVVKIFWGDEWIDANST